MNEWIVPAVSGLFLLGGAFLAFLGTRGKTQSDSRVALDARLDVRMTREIERLDERIDDQEKEITELKTALRSESRVRTAALRVIRSLVAQWPCSPWTRLNPLDVAELDENTIPSHWKE
jgi:hypothetical protein